jgi:ribosome maturation factor RimP
MGPRPYREVFPLKKEHLDRVRELALQAAALCGAELVELEYKPGSGDPVLRLYIDKPGGVSVGDCTQVSRAMADALDTEDPIPSSYRLEVSSPGVDKALKTAEDFERYKEFPALLVLKRPNKGRSTVSGIVEGCDGESVALRLDSGEERFRLEEIARARLNIDPWEMAKTKRKNKHAG